MVATGRLVFIDSYCNNLRYQIHFIQWKRSKLTITKQIRVLTLFCFENCFTTFCVLQEKYLVLGNV